MSKKTVLIVDDTFENLYLLRVILEEAGFNVIEANDGSEGLKRLHENHNVDLIISDILMPIMDGYLFCQACKKEKLFKNIPFVFYTSTYTEKLDEDFALKLGAAQFLRKPIDHDEILFVVNDIFDSVKKQVKYSKKVRISEGEVLKLYSERLINKLEQKSLDLGHEVVERKRAEQLLIHKNEILDLIAVNTPLNKIFDRLLLNYESVHPNYFGSISLLDEAGTHLNIESAPSMPKPYNLAMKGIAIGKNVGSCGTAAFTKKPVIVSDISNDALWVDYRDIALKHHLKSCWALPILTKNNVVLGAFAIYSKSVSTPSLDEIHELNFAVSLALIAIERFRVVLEIRKKDESYKSLIDQASDAIMSYNIDGTIYNFNKASYINLGYTEEEFLKLKIQDFLFGEIIQNQDRYDKLLNGEPILIDRQFIRKDKSLIDVEISAKKQKDGRILGIARDITEAIKNTKELKLAKEFSDKLIMSMQEGLLIVNLEAEIIMVNNSLCDMLGYSKEELIGLNLPYPFAKTEDFEEMSITKDKVATGDASFFKFEFIRKSGEKFWASFLAGNIKNDQGEVIALFGTIKDISEEEKAKKLLVENAAKSNQKKNVILELASLVGTDYKTTLEKITTLSAETLNVARVGVWKFNDVKNEIECEKLFDFNNQNFESGGVLSEMQHPNYFEAIFKNKIISINDAIKDTVTESFSEKYLLPKGITSMLDVVIHVSNDLYGVLCFEHVGSKRVWSKDDEEFATSLANLVSLMVESTERNIVERELESEKEFSEKLITSLHEGLSVVDLEGKHVKVNAALCRMTGFAENELLGSAAPFPYWPPEEYDNIFEAFKNPTKNLGENNVFTLMRKNGERFPVSISAAVIKNNQGKVIAYFSTIIDISLRVKAENVLLDNIRIADQRKNIIIELAGLIGEDFNESLKKIATTTAEALSVDLVTIWEYQNNYTELLSKLFYNPAAANTFDIDGLRVSKAQIPNYFNAFKNKNSINISDVSNNPITKEFAKEYFEPNNIYSRIDVIIYGRKNHYGILSFESSTPNRVFNNEEESFVTSIASIVSLMVESSERKLAENEAITVNEQLTIANNELNKLRNQLEQENVYLRNEIDLVFNYEEMVYGSVEFSDVLSEVEKVAPTNATVLLLGESGTGKELLARAVHNISLRNKKPLIKVNCSAIPRELMESELFGHKKGSFTGAVGDKVGKFELADGGTLFLDEIGELPLDMQPKILRFLQEGEIEVVGGTGMKKLDVRVIAATNRNLKEEIEKKQFREDLYFRLNVFPIVVPPLRNRRDDISLLVEHFVDKFNKAYGKNIKYISDEAMSQLRVYDWPGNIRELENLIERASILSTDETLIIPGFESKVQKSKSSINNINLSLDFAQRNHILQVLEQCHWKISGANGAAVLLDLKPSTLRDKMAKLDITKP